MWPITTWYLADPPATTSWQWTSLLQRPRSHTGLGINTIVVIVIIIFTTTIITTAIIVNMVIIFTTNTTTTTVFIINLQASQSSTLLPFPPPSHPPSPSPSLLPSFNPEKRFILIFYHLSASSPVFNQCQTSLLKKASGFFITPQNLPLPEINDQRSSSPPVSGETGAETLEVQIAGIHYWWLLQITRCPIPSSDHHCHSHRNHCNHCLRY